MFMDPHAKGEMIAKINGRSMQALQFSKYIKVSDAPSLSLSRACRMMSRAQR